MRVLIVGAGAVGGYFGALMARAGRDVTFLVRPARAERLRENGLVVRNGDASFTIAPRLEVCGAVAATYDAIVVAVKAYALGDAVRDLTPAMGPETMVVPLLNGMRHLDALVKRFGERAVLGGVSAVVSTLDADGAIAVTGTQAFMRYGERGGGISPRVAAFDAAVRAPGLDAEASANILVDMWHKWLVLVSLGVANTLACATVGEIVAAGGAWLPSAILDEAAAVSAASGFTPDPAVLAGYRAFLTTPDAPVTSSMYRDLVAGLPTEAEHIVGDLTARGRTLGVATPLLDAGLVHLRAYQRRLAAT